MGALGLTGARTRLLGLPVPVQLVAGAALAVVAAAGLLVAPPAPSPGAAMTVTVAVAFLPLSVLVLRRVPGHPLGRLMLTVGALAYLASAAVGWSWWTPAAWASKWLWIPAVTLIAVILLVVPDGRLPGTRWQALLALLLTAAGVLTVSVAAGAVVRPRTLLSGDPGPPDPFLTGLAPVVQGSLLATGAAALGVLGSLVVRWVRADEVTRRQLACLVPAGVLLLLGVALDAAGVPLAWAPAVVAFPLGLTVAALRYHLHDLDLYLHRGTVWAVLTALAIAAFVGVAAAVGTVVALPGSPVPTVVAAAVVAALLLPAQSLVQRAVRRLLYGRRDEPYAVLTGLGRRLGTVRDPLAVMPEIAAAVVDALRVPYAAVRVREEDGSTHTAAEFGRWADAPSAFPMVANGREVGELVVAPRQVGTRFTPAEDRLLHDLAGQAALAADACRSAIALRAARDRLVLAREEERRRLRRDLHDGVASALVGTRMLAQAVRRVVPADGPAPALIDTLAADLDGCTTEVRDLIDGLRPAALDDGLGPALAALVERFRTQGGLPVELTVAGDLADLPAAVEVVAYRVVTEALTNVVKHAGAGRARVGVDRDDRHLAVAVEDDGRGLPPSALDGPAGSGVGLSSIRSRAEELGGRCDVRSDASGTSIAVLLPLGV